MSEPSLGELSFKVDSLQKQLDRSERAVDEAKAAASRAREDAQRTATDQVKQAIAENDRLWSERFDRMRKDIDSNVTRITSLEADVKRNTDTLNVLVADVKSLREDKSDQKALIVFIRNAVIGALLSLGLTWVLHNPK